MTPNAYAAALVLAAVPVGIASAVLGVWIVRMSVAWWVGH